MEHLRPRTQWGRQVDITEWSAAVPGTTAGYAARIATGALLGTVPTTSVFDVSSRRSSVILMF